MVNMTQEIVTLTRMYIHHSFYSPGQSPKIKKNMNLHVRDLEREDDGLIRTANQRNANAPSWLDIT